MIIIVYIEWLLNITAVSIASQCSREGHVRLVNGTTLQEGRLEVCISSSWGTVCHNGWNFAHARVVCRQLKYQDNGESI